jgi:hypothetical protein
MYSVSRRELAKRAWRSGATVLDVSRCLTSAAVTPLSNALNGVDKVCVSSFIKTGVGRHFVIFFCFLVVAKASAQPISSISEWQSM